MSQLTGMRGMLLQPLLLAQTDAKVPFKTHRPIDSNSKESWAQWHGPSGMGVALLLALLLLQAVKPSLAYTVKSSFNYQGQNHEQRDRGRLTQAGVG